jgi:hypothetical protein
MTHWAAQRIVRTRPRLLLALATAVVSLLLLAGAIAAADFAAGPGVLAALLAVPLTLGIPATCAALGVTWLWPGGPPLWLFAALCVGAGSALQFAAFTMLLRLRRVSA